jgi:hypothetical protein
MTSRFLVLSLFFCATLAQAQSPEALTINAVTRAVRNTGNINFGAGQLLVGGVAVVGGAGGGASTDFAARKVITVSKGTAATDTRTGISVYDDTRPFASLAAAKAAAASGDTIHVMPGSYNGDSLLKNGVNWHFDAGATVTAVSDPIFSDIGIGAVTSSITGHLIGVADPLGSVGLVKITNGSSNVYLEFQSLTATGVDAVPIELAAGTLRAVARKGLYNAYYDCVIFTGGTLFLEAGEILSTSTSAGDSEGEALELSGSGIVRITAGKIQSNFDAVTIGNSSADIVINADEINGGLLAGGLYPQTIVITDGSATINARRISGGTYNDGVKVEGGALSINGAAITTGGAKKDLVRTGGTLAITGTKYDSAKTTGTITQSEPLVAGAAQKSANLSDLTSASTARNNLGAAAGVWSEAQIHADIARDTEVASAVAPKVTGPASVTDARPAVFDGTTGKQIREGVPGTDYTAVGGTPAVGRVPKITSLGPPIVIEWADP